MKNKYKLICCIIAFTFFGRSSPESIHTVAPPMDIPKTTIFSLSLIDKIVFFFENFLENILKF